MFKASWKYALFCGIFLIILYYLSAFFGVNPQINTGHLIFDILIFGLFIFFALKEFRTYNQDGILHFWQGMTIGFTVYVMSTILFSIFLFFYFDEQAVMEYKEAATAFLNSKSDIYLEQFGEEGFANQLNEIKNVTASDLVISSGMKKLLAGFFITPVISIILRKQPK